jgi:hypothetical protein
MSMSLEQFGVYMIVPTGKTTSLCVKNLKQSTPKLSIKNLMEMGNLDKESTAVVSKSIDKSIEQKDLADSAKWAVEAVKSHYPKIKTMAQVNRMLTLAYLLGSSMSNIVNDVTFARYKNKSLKSYYRWMKKNISEEQANKMLANTVMSKKKGKTVVIKFSLEDYDLIKDKILATIPQLEAKLNQEQALKKAKDKE